MLDEFISFESDFKFSNCSELKAIFLNWGVQSKSYHFSAMLRNDGYEQLLTQTNNEFKLSVSAVNPNGCAKEGTLTLCVGSAKNFKRNQQEFKVGQRPMGTEYNFQYTNPHRSSIVIALYNRKSFWSQDQELGKTEITLDKFDANYPCEREVQLGENGPRVMIRAQRTENF